MSPVLRTVACICPYIASVMLDANDTSYFNVTGMQVWDGTFGNHALTEDIPTATFMARFKDVFSIHDTFTEFMHDASQSCGYTDYMSKYLVYPAVGSQPANLPGQDANNNYLPGCDVFDQAFFAVEEVNPCFSPYSIFHRCPLLYDPLGFSDGYDYIPAGSGPVYLGRPDVKAAINAPPDQTWVFCSSTPVFVNSTDNSLLGGPASQLARPSKCH
jgi:carboxypeptidase D